MITVPFGRGFAAVLIHCLLGCRSFSEEPPAPQPDLRQTAAESKQIGMEKNEEWLAARVAGVVIKQDQEELNRGKLKFSGLEMDLWETPPLFVKQLKAKNGALLLGEEDDRNRFGRDVCLVRVVEGKLECEYLLSVRYPQFGEAGGLVFFRDDKVVERFGVIIPNPPVQAKGDEMTPHQKVLLIVHGLTEFVEPEEVAKIPVQPIDPAKMVVISTGNGEPPKAARILWYQIDENGALKETHP